MIEFLNTYVFGILSPIMLMFAGLYFTLRLRAFYITRPVTTLHALKSGAARGGVSPFRAVTLALAGTLGVGNIVGVASAIALGGCGAVFWMWISALLAMMLKYAEILLAVSHRRRDGEGSFGGAVYYIRDYFSRKKRDGLGVVIAGIFGVFCIVNSFTMGCVIQSNAVSRSFLGVWGVSPWIVGGILVVLCLFVILKSSYWVSAFTEKTVPVMTVGYILLSLAAILMGADRIPYAFARIFEEAFDFGSAASGVLGFFLSRSVRFGAMRGLMSNEAGCGTAPTAHASADTDSPAKQGVWGIFEVFVDTLVLCTMTALVIIIFWRGEFADDPMMMTVSAFSAALGGWAGGAVAVSVLLFAFATMICWAHYGKESLRYFSRNKRLSLAYSFAFCAFAFIGAISAPDSIWGIADLALGVMTVINVAVICLMSREVVEETERYFGRKR